MAISEQVDPLSRAFAALADPTRRAILARLALGDADVSELMKPFALTQPTISKHLKVLERAGLVARGRCAAASAHACCAPAQGHRGMGGALSTLLGAEIRQPRRLPE